MSVLLLLCVVAGIVAKIRGGTLEALVETEFQLTPLLFVGLALQVGFAVADPDWLTDSLSLVILLASHLLVGAFIWANRRFPGMILAGVGLLLNVIVIASNGAMPVSEWAADVARVSADLSDPDFKHEVMSDATWFPWLADVIPLPRLGEVVSVGDVVLAVGLGVLVYGRMMSARSEAVTE